MIAWNFFVELKHLIETIKKPIVFLFQPIKLKKFKVQNNYISITYKVCFYFVVITKFEC